MKTRSLVIFGRGNIASLAWYYLTHDSNWRIDAFTVERANVGDGIHERLPVVPFDKLASLYPPDRTALLIPLGYQHINSVRRERFMQGRACHYSFASYISSRASVWPDLVVGENSLIGEKAIVEPYTRLGENVIVRGGAHVSHHCKVADHVFISPQASVGANVSIGEQAVIGVGAVIRDGVSIGARSFIGAGAVVLDDTEPDSAYIGNPAYKDAKNSLEATS